MENPWVVAVCTFAIIGLSAFFVAVEFALLAAKRHRFEDAAGRSRAARAALRSSGELTVLLAGAQLGITVCTLALGAITKPAVHHWLKPALADLGGPSWFADAGSFVLALVVVTFLHLVVGEMAPKSWAIAHPERSAMLLALPMRGFMWVTRPALRALNSVANWCLHRVGVEATDHVVTRQDPAALRHLVEHSANVGALEAGYAAPLTGALDLRDLRVRDLVTPRRELAAVERDATVGDVQAASRASGHLRILVRQGEADWGVVHVRDTLTRDVAEPIRDLTRQALRLDGQTPLHTALAQMRETRNQLAVVLDGTATLGVITLDDVLRRLLPLDTATPA
ncbi:HlyC/CorC family transporter [Frankia sp. CNm7]|uniref:HlyC/CorC family transporter n=1 Tax=Frankia nepalensis TaxID=1836974 RepID=A0A937RH73_9ACTN|nr:hemolysin family protein [Frankia nepalensis]MBL7501928.1 HlyC/CorC family transporter [Frankia nepalensis]MBL7514529.1 HlyC/CorC family transporter [Frankia nepalensis]MBL7524185.1 HlyC/CorC family transporter [Frankia nepalensis]MBL7628804.1 HlyC/CorC family transporter [Frankia nepalensis]